MLFAELSGLAAALCWTISSLMAPTLIQRFGPMRFNTIRITMASAILILICLLTQRFNGQLWGYLDSIILSGLIGIFLGDTLLFSAIHRLGPRRTGVLFATNAPMSILLSWLFFNEQLSLQQLFACAIVLSGVVIAILFGKRMSFRKSKALTQPTLSPSNNHAWEDTRGKLSTGIIMALGAALGQASGALLSKPAMLAGVDPIAVSALRVTAGALALLVAYSVFYRHKQAVDLLPLSQLNKRDYLGVFTMATIGMVIGMSLLVWGVGNANIGIVTTLSAVVPVLILPGLWITTGQRPAIGAWIGAILVVLGATLIILH